MKKLRNARSPSRVLAAEAVVQLLFKVGEMGVRVTVISTISTQPPMIADELRRQADVFIDLQDLSEKIGRDSGDRSARMQNAPSFLQRPATSETQDA